MSFKGSSVGRPRKKAQDLTNEQALRKLFPKKVADAAAEEAQKNRKKNRRNPSKEKG
jgi:hypothetical protein